MHKSINIDKAAEHVKNIIDTNRCAICDKSNGKRMRYPCGHTSCDDCVPDAESCPICLTPQDSSTFAVPLLDQPHTQRSQNSINLLNAFQPEFSVDLYKRYRVSEQLKVEREIFPQCIQAPAKYYNKRRSSKLCTENKENNTVFPGEEVSSLNNMENSNANVREWLNKCGKRKPLGELNHSRTRNSLQKQPLKVINTQKIDRSHRKRNHSQVWVDENQTFIDEYVAPSKKQNKENTVDKLEIKRDSSTDLQKGKNKDDSGISIDDDLVIVIDDSPSVRADKDMNAWLAVLESEKYGQCGSTSLRSQDLNISQKMSQPHKPKVPFYVKSPLSESCNHCSLITSVNNDEKPEEQPNISITVESKSFTAIINVSNAERVQTNSKHSVEVQTDNQQNDGKVFVDGIIVSEERDVIESTQQTPCSSKSEDIFLSEANHFSPVNRTVNRSSNVIIAESDSDEDVEHSTSLQVTADVHRSYDEILVLGDVENLQEHSKRPRRAARGLSPASTDSSDKENYNPNRMRKSFNSKKKPVKK